MTGAPQPRELATATGSVTVTDHGAQLLQWQVDAVPVVWLSEQAEYAADRAVRGGVPVCWPWFAAGPDGDHSPSHGLLRTAPWEPLPPEPDGDTLSLRWRIRHDQVGGGRGVEQFPHPFSAELSVAVGRDCVVRLAVTNTGTEAFRHEGALHTYLHVGDVRQVTLNGLEGTAYWDKVTGRDGLQDGPLAPVGEVDRIYRSTAPVQLNDPVLGRVLHITGEGTTDTVVWSPGPQKGPALPDLGAGWSRMLCVEAAALHPRSPVLGPGRTWEMSTRIAVEHPDG